MPSTFANLITTSLLTFTCATVLFVLYRHALAPILKRHNIVPLRDLSQAITNRYQRRRYHRLGEGGYGYSDDDGDGNGDGDGEREGRLSRDLEEGFRDESSDEEEGDERLRRSGEVRR